MTPSLLRPRSSIDTDIASSSSAASVSPYDRRTARCLRVAAPGVLDLDHRRAERREELRRVGSGERDRQVHDGDPSERAGLGVAHWPSIRLPDTVAMAMHGASRTSSVTAAEGLRLAVFEWGDPDGDALVLLHGGGLSSGEWTEIGPLLAAGRRVVSFDARGCGESDPDPERRYGVRTIGDDLDRVRAALGLASFVLVGHSFGAVTACVYAASIPPLSRASYSSTVVPRTTLGPGRSRIRHSRSRRLRLRPLRSRGRSERLSELVSRRALQDGFRTGR